MGSYIEPKNRIITQQPERVIPIEDLKPLPDSDDDDVKPEVKVEVKVDDDDEMKPASKRLKTS